MHGLVFLGQASDDTIALRVHRPNNNYNSAIAEILAMIALGGNSGYLSFICAYLAVTYLIVHFETLSSSQFRYLLLSRLVELAGPIFQKRLCSSDV